jgi:hypothetical protein
MSFVCVIDIKGLPVELVTPEPGSKPHTVVPSLYREQELGRILSDVASEEGKTRLG